jgi:hypothetical protein
MAKLAPVEALLGKVAPLIEKLPFIPKKAAPKTGAHEPFDDLEDASPDSDESFEPNALPTAHPGGPARPRIDFGAIVKAFLGNRLLLGVTGALLVVVLAMAVTAILADRPPPAPAVLSKPVTEEGRALARRFLLPPDPALDLSPPMEREPKLVYTDEDMKTYAPVHDPRDLGILAKQNDEDAAKVLGAAR